MVTALLHTNQGKHKTNHIYSLPTTLMLKNRIMVIRQGFAVTCLIIWTISVDSLQYNYVTAPMLLVCLSYILYSPKSVTERHQPKVQETSDELLDFIIEHQGFPVVKAKEKFGRSNEKCKEVWDDLEKWNLLKRWKDNARVLADDLLALLHSPEGSVSYS